MLREFLHSWGSLHTKCLRRFPFCLLGSGKSRLKKLQRYDRKPGGRQITNIRTVFKWWNHFEEAIERVVRWLLKRKIQYCSHIWGTKYSSRTESWLCQNCLPADVVLEKGSERRDSGKSHGWSVCKVATYNDSDHQKRKHMESSVKYDMFSKTLYIRGNNHSWLDLCHVLQPKI